MEKKVDFKNFYRRNIPIFLSQIFNWRCERVAMVFFKIGLGSVVGFP